MGASRNSASNGCCVIKVLLVVGSRVVVVGCFELLYLRFQLPKSYVLHELPRCSLESVCVVVAVVFDLLSHHGHDLLGSLLPNF